jgi:hypothetical protein
LRPYATVSPQFWTGATGKKLRTDPDAQRVAFYLITSPHSHQTGLYYLPTMYLCHEVGLSEEGAYKALTTLEAERFSIYDKSSEWIWVCGMASWQIGSQLSPADKRCKGVQQYLGTLPVLPFIDAFIDHYASDFHLAIRGLKGPFSDQEQNRTGTDPPQAAPEILNGSHKSPRPRRQATAQSVPFPEDLVLTEKMRIQALEAKRDCDPDAWFVKFRAHHEAHGKRMKSWSAAWITWIGNADSFGYPKSKTVGSW